MRRKGLKAAIPRRPRRAIRRNRALGASLSLRRGGGFLQNAASTATGVAGGVVLGNLLGGLLGGHGGGGLFGGGANAAGLGGAGLTGSNPTEITEINNYYDDKPDRGSDADFQQFDPGAPGVQDANFDNLDDSTFDNSSSRRRRRLRRRLRSGLVSIDRRGVLSRLAAFVLQHDHLRADGHALVKVDHILVHHPDAA